VRTILSCTLYLKLLGIICTCLYYDIIHLLARGLLPYSEETRKYVCFTSHFNILPFCSEDEVTKLRHVLKLKLELLPLLSLYYTIVVATLFRNLWTKYWNKHLSIVTIYTSYMLSLVFNESSDFIFIHWEMCCYAWREMPLFNE